MILALPYPPTANLYWRVFRGRPVKSAKARDYQRTVALLAKSQLGTTKPLEGDVSVVVSVYRPRKVGDLDNTLKVLLDALKGVVYVDDSQVAELVATRRDDKDNPRAVVTVSKLGDQ